MRARLCILLLAAVGLLGCDDATAPLRVEESGCDGPDLGTRSPGCTDLGDFIHTAGLLNTGGEAAAVATHRGYAFVADGASGLLVVDACDPTRMSVLSRVPTDAPALDVAYMNGRVLVATEEGLEVVSVAQPHSPVAVAAARGAGRYCDVDVDPGRRLAYVADDVVGLVVYDVSSPGGPDVLGVENTPGQATGVCVEGDIAYVADARLGLRVVSVSSPEEPWLIRAVDTPGHAAAVAVWNGLAVVADGSAGLTIIDVSSPAQATVVGGAATDEAVTDVTVDAGRAFALARSGELLVYGLRNPASPGLRARSAGEPLGTGVTVTGGAAFLSHGVAGIRVVDVRTTAMAPISARLGRYRGNARVIVADGNRFFVGDDEEGVYIGEWREDHFARLGDVHIGSVVHNITMYEGRLYACAGDLGVQIVDVSNPLNPVVAGQIPGSSGAVDVAIADSVAFTVRGGLARPTTVDLRRINDPPTGLNIRGGVVSAVDVGSRFAYFVQVQGNLFVVSLDPRSLTPLRWSQTTHGTSADVRVYSDPMSGGERLFIANRAGSVDSETGVGFSAGVEVYDLSRPMQPEFMTMIDTSIPAERIAFSGEVMYVTGGDAGLELFDVSDVSSPVPIGSYSTTSPVRAAAAVPGAVILALGEEGLIALPPPCE
jgi:hypothetical protein